MHHYRRVMTRGTLFLHRLFTVCLVQLVSQPAVLSAPERSRSAHKDSRHSYPGVFSQLCDQCCCMRWPALRVSWGNVAEVIIEGVFFFFYFLTQNPTKHFILFRSYCFSVWIICVIHFRKFGKLKWLKLVNSASLVIAFSWFRLWTLQQVLTVFVK